MVALVLVRGLPGSGKSATATIIADDFDGMHFEADMWQMTDGKYDWQPGRVRESHRSCLAATEAALSRGISVAVSNTFTRLFEMEEYIKLAKKYDVDFYVVKADGPWTNVHNVPTGVLHAMAQRWDEYKGEMTPIQYHVRRMV